jgi:hypothetical protein
MTKAQKSLIFYGGTLFVVGTLTVLSFIGTPRPRVPFDERHGRPLVVAACRDCHAPGKEAPLPAAHPPKEQCLTCHRAKRK